VLEQAGCTHRLEIGDIGVLRAEVPRASISLAIPPDVALPLRLPLGGTAARLVLALPGRGVGDSLPGGTGSFIVETFGATLGGRLVIAVDADISLPPGRVSVQGRVETFIRDITPLPMGCAPEAPSAE